MRYDRIITGYHGCDAKVAQRVLDGEAFQPSENDYDWLGKGVYFWEYGADRAYRFAENQISRGRVTKPAVVGALIQLGACFDLLDTMYTHDLATFYRRWEAKNRNNGLALPVNAGRAPDHKLRRLDCAVLNQYLEEMGDVSGKSFDTVRGCFTEGEPIFETSGFRLESHIQIAVRNPACIIGVFRPR